MRLVSILFSNVFIYYTLSKLFFRLSSYAHFQYSEKYFLTSNTAEGGVGTADKVGPQYHSDPLMHCIETNTSSFFETHK